MTTAAEQVSTPLRINPLAPAFGGEPVDVDLSQPMSPGLAAQLRDAAQELGVLVFRGQSLSPETQIAVSRQFGPLQEVAQKQYQMAGRPEIYIIGNVVENGRAIADPSVGRLWHSDQSFISQPAFGSLLYGVECPPGGGETWFSSNFAAYEALDDGLKARLETLSAVHSFAEYYNELRNRDATQPELTSERRQQFPDVLHPIVRRCPLTGRKALYVNPAYTTRIDCVEEREGRDLLQFLFEHQRREEFLYVHGWRVGDVVMWNNLAVNHKGTPFDTQKYVRRMHRCTIASTAEEYAATLLT